MSDKTLYTNDQLDARLRFLVGVVLALTLFGTVIVILYSLVFVVQPLNGISAADKAFFRILEPIATFLVGALSGMVLSRTDQNSKNVEIPPSAPATIPVPEPEPEPDPEPVKENCECPKPKSSNNQPETYI